MGNIGESSIGLLVSFSSCLYSINAGLTIQNAECPLFINKDGKFVIFSHPIQECRGLTGVTWIDVIKAIRTVPVQNVQ
jgi:hypothetical protein